MKRTALLLLALGVLAGCGGDGKARAREAGALCVPAVKAKVPTDTPFTDVQALAQDHKRWSVTGDVIDRTGVTHHFTCVVVTDTTRDRKPLMVQSVTTSP